MSDSTAVIRDLLRPEGTDHFSEEELASLVTGTR
jgi:hypothetical protein